MIYIMNGKQFIEQYINLDYDIVKTTQFVIVSSSIRKKCTPRWEKQIVSATSFLYPRTHLIMEYDTYKEKEYETEYRAQLKAALPFFATIVKYFTDDPDMNIVFLCGYKERKYRYLKLIRKFMMMEFQIPVLEWDKAYMKQLPDPLDYNFGYASKHSSSIVKRAKKQQHVMDMTTDAGRRKYYEKLSRCKLEKEMKRIGMYVPNMSKYDMVDILETFG